MKECMDLIQSLRRIGQQFTGWKHSTAMLYAQLPLITKLYSKKGFRIKLTCSACPEQYDVFKDDKQVAYLRLRHGEFRVDVPDCGGDTIYEAEPNGEGIFDDVERIVYLNKALKAICQSLTPAPLPDINR